MNRVVLRAAVATVIAMVGALLVHVPAAQSAPVGLRVDGTRVVEANGSAFVMRGVSHAHVWYPTQTSSFANIKNLGANAVRVVLGSGQRWGPSTDVGAVVALCKQNRLICVLEAHDTTGYGEDGAAATLDQAVTYWISQKNALVGQEDYVVINIGNEPFGNNASVSATWATATSNAVQRLRSNGFHHLIMADAPMWGQDWQNIMRDNAASVEAADPDHNTLFSIHMYGVYDTAEEINAYFDAFRTAGLPLVVGEFGFNHSDGNPDEDTIMAQAQARGLGYLGWSWSGNGGGVEYLDMVTNFDPTQLTSWGDRIFNGANGIRATAREATIFGATTPDDEAPSTPGTPTASSVTSTGVTLSWPASTDNVGVTGYDVLRATGTSGTFTSVGTTATTSYPATDLSPETTYRFTIRAHDAAGNTSPNSTPVTVTTPAGPATGPCQVTYQATNWGGSSGFTANVTITNTGTTPIDGWTLTFAFPSGQQVSQGWGATWSQSGTTVSATNLDYNHTIAPGTSAGAGFNGTYTTSNPPVTTFTLNNTTCTTT